MEVTGQDSTLYLLAAKLIILQTFHYMNQTTASSSLALLLFSLQEKHVGRRSGPSGRERKRERHPSRDPSDRPGLISDWYYRSVN